jgi:glycine/serine hydroxymethyltransferase
MTARPPSEEARLARLVRAHDRWRGREVFNLLASENAVSPAARKLLSSDLAGRYTLPVEADFHGETIDNSYTGTRYTDAIEALANAAAARVFRARCATTRPLSGHIAALSALAPLLPTGSRLLAIAPDEGGYDGYAPGFLPSLLGYTVRPLPADGPGNSVVEERAVETIRRERPNAIVLGQSFFLFPYPLRAIAEAAHAVDALVFYDASHVLGLIAGRSKTRSGRARTSSTDRPTSRSPGRRGDSSSRIERTCSPRSTRRSSGARSTTPIGTGSPGSRRRSSSSSGAAPTTPGPWSPTPRRWAGA